MKEQNPIHIKLEYEEAIQSRRDILSSEMNLIEIMKCVQRFGLLRKEELIYKIKLQKKMKELMINIKQLQEMLPKVKIPEILKEPKEERRKKNIGVVDTNLERELMDIQEKLKSLAG
jgi:hypothetical protein